MSDLAARGDAGGSGGSSPQASTAGGSAGSSPQASTAGGSAGSSPQAGTTLGRGLARRAGASPWLAVTVVFFVNGLLFASWTAHIPHVKDYLRLDDGALGIALLGAPAGSVLAMLLAAPLLPRLGSKTIVRITLVGYCVAGPLVGLTRSFAMLFVALMAWGAFQGTLDVSMNTQAIAVERQAGRPLMPGFHGSWSVGAFAGAAAGVIGVALGLSLSAQLLLLAAPCLLIAGWLTTAMIGDRHPRHAPPDHREHERPDHQQHPPTGSRSRARTRSSRRRVIWMAIVVLGGIAVADMLCEGAAADWAAVYLRTSLHAAPAVAALGYAAYSLAMVAVRLGGNRLLARFAVHRLLPFLAALATVLFAAGLAINLIPLVLAGFAGLGAGVAAVIPAVFSAAGRVPGINAGTAVAIVSAFGWAGFVCGPVIIGQLAGVTSLRLALALLPALTALVAVSTGTSRVLRATDDGQGR